MIVNIHLIAEHLIVINMKKPIFVNKKFFVFFTFMRVLRMWGFEGF